MKVQENRTNKLNQEVFTIYVDLASKKLDPEEPYPVPFCTDQIMFYSCFIDKNFVEKECYRQGYWPEEWDIVGWGIYNPDGSDEEF